MSHFPSSHLVTKFDSKNSAPLTGQRLAKIRYKTTEKQSAKFPSVCVSVPHININDISDNIPALMPYIVEMLQNAQDGCIRSLYESSDGVMSSVNDADISIAACIGYLAAESQGSRMTKEFLESWFDTSVKDYVTAIIAEKLGYGDKLTTEQMNTISKHVSGYKGMYSALAGGKTMFQEKQVSSLLRVLDMIEDTSGVADKLKVRLANMLNKPKIEELLEL